MCARPCSNVYKHYFINPHLSAVRQSVLFAFRFADEELRHREFGELELEQPGSRARSTVLLFPLKTEQIKIGFRFPNGFPSSKVGWNESSKETQRGEESTLTCRKWAGGSWGLGSLFIWAQRRVFGHLHWDWPHALSHLRCRVSLPVAPSSVYWPPPMIYR